MKLHWSITALCLIASACTQKPDEQVPTPKPEVGQNEDPLLISCYGDPWGKITIGKYGNVDEPKDTDGRGENPKVAGTASGCSSSETADESLFTPADKGYRLSGEKFYGEACVPEESVDGDGFKTLNGTRYSACSLPSGEGKACRAGAEGGAVFCGPKKLAKYRNTDSCGEIRLNVSAMVWGEYFDRDGAGVNAPLGSAQQEMFGVFQDGVTGGLYGPAGPATKNGLRSWGLISFGGNTSSGLPLRSQVSMSSGSNCKCINQGYGANCKIGPNCYIRGNTSIGDHCHIGQSVEIKNCLILSHTNVGHLSYIGDSVLGEKVNLGAGTTTSNLRHDGKNHRSMVGGVLVDTGRRKFGTIIGDGVHTGINTSIYPGRKLWPHTTTRPGEIVQHDLQSQD